MEIDIEQFKELVADTFRKLRLLETELHAYRFAIHLVTEQGLADPVIPWRTVVAAAKENPVIVELMAKKYDPLIREVTTCIDLAEAQAKVLELLRKWQPSGPPN